MHTLWTTPQSDNRALLFLDNNGLPWTVSAPDKVTVVPVRRNGNFQTPISVPAVRPKRCHTLLNPAHRQDQTVACLNYTLQTMMPLPGWLAMAPKCIRQQQQWVGLLTHTWLFFIDIILVVIASWLSVKVRSYPIWIFWRGLNRFSSDCYMLKKTFIVQNTVSGSDW